jgi:hypothetical protein
MTQGRKYAIGSAEIMVAGRRDERHMRSTQRLEASKSQSCIRLTQSAGTCSDKDHRHADRSEKGFDGIDAWRL